MNEEPATSTTFVDSSTIFFSGYPSISNHHQNIPGHHSFAVVPCEPSAFQKQLDGAIDNIITLDGETRCHLRRLLSNHPSLLYWKAYELDKNQPKRPNKRNMKSKAVYHNFIHLISPFPSDIRGDHDPRCRVIFECQEFGV